MFFTNQLKNGIVSYIIRNKIYVYITQEFKHETIKT